MRRRTNPLKKFLPAIVVVALVGGLIAVYGAKRSPDGADRPSRSSANVDEQLELAVEFLDEGDADKALDLLDDMEASAKKNRLSEEASFVRLKALSASGRDTSVVEKAEVFMAEFSDSQHAVEVEMLRLTSAVASAGLSNPQLLRSVENFIEDHPEAEGSSRLEMALARQEMKLGDDTSARRRLSGIVATAADPIVAREAKLSLGEMNFDAFLAGNWDVPRSTYEVESGDAVWNIARKHSVSSELLMKVNGITDPTRLRVGQVLDIPQTNFELVCNVATNELDLYSDGIFLKSYDVRTGRRPGTTPEGEFKILNKKTDPTWRPGDGRVYLPGDPNNELGTRWMAFEGDILGIHGTIHPETVGHYASNGCIGMTTGDVEELFDLITVGTPLTIIGEQDLANAQIIPSPEIPAPMTEREIASLRP